MAALGLLGLGQALVLCLLGLLLVGRALEVSGLRLKELLGGLSLGGGLFSCCLGSGRLPLGRGSKGGSCGGSVRGV